MRVMLLSPYGANLARTIESAGDIVLLPDGSGNVDKDMDFLVMFGHRQIIHPAFIKAFPGKVINVHPSLLPWGRGSHPNFWSWYEDTPKGVSLHFADEGIDTGPIIASEQIYFNPAGETLRTTYDHLQKSAEDLFARMWPTIRQGTTGLRQDPKNGSSHKKKDLDCIWPNLSLQWDTPVEEVMELGKLARGESSGKHPRIAT